jgi:anti-sigma B factor antagonist
MLEIKTSDLNEETCLVELNGEIDAYSSDQLREHIDQIIKSGKTRAVVDLGNLSYIDSTGLGLLVRWTKELRNSKGDVHLLNPGRRVDNVIRLTNLKRFFKIFTDRDKAMKF